jgi:hypothetical protein
MLYAVRPGGRMQPPKVKAFLEFLEPRLDFNKSFPMPCSRASADAALSA